MEALNLDQEFWKKKLCLKVKKLKDNSMYIEGYANPYTMDRVKEIINPKAWRLDSFNKAGVILFNHDQNKPIGKPVSVEKRDQGLYIKARISGSNDPEISKIRDLIDEGILNQFSVGFKTHDSKRLNDGNTEITDAELFEVSVVSVPANADSLFNMSVKYMKNETLNSTITEYLKMKHANAALSFREELKKKNILISSAQDILIKETSIPADVIERLTSGEMEWKADFYQLVNKLFGINVKAATEDDNDDDTIPSDDSASSESSDTDSNDSMGSDDEEVKEYKEEEKEDKAMEESQKEALTKVFEEEMMMALSEDVPGWVSDIELWNKAKAISEETLGTVSYAFVVWYYHKSSDSAKHITIKNRLITVKNGEAGMASLPIAPAPQTSVAVKPSTAVDTEVNPYKQQAEQTNVLLGLVVNLLQTISSQLESSNSNPKQGLELPPMVQATETATAMDAEQAKSLAVVNRYMESLSLRLKALNL